MPSGITTTGWPAVESKLKQLGLGFDGWQQGATRLILGKRADGLYASTIGGVFLSLPRQVGKTYMLSAIVFALCLLFPGLTVLWTAHRLKTTGETHKAWKALAKRKRIAPMVETIRSGSGDWEVQFRNGSRILLGARENGFGRGFAKVDIVVFDEAQILTDRALDDMVPAANASTFPAGALILYAGTPPKPDDPSEVFTRARETALSGESDDMLYIECSADPSVDPTKWPPGYVDFEALAEANPSYPLRTPRASILRMAKQLSRESLRREGYGIWDLKTANTPTIAPAAWTAGLVREAPDGPPAYGVRFSLDGQAVSLAGAVLDGERVHVEAIARLSADDLAMDDLPLAQWLAARFATCAAIVVDGKAGVGALVEDLRTLGVLGYKLIVPTTDQAITAHAQFLATINAGTLTHPDQTELNQAAKVATKRPIGTAGGWGWRSVDGSDVLDLEAATLAAYGARQRPPLKTTRKVRVMI